MQNWFCKARAYASVERAGHSGENFLNKPEQAKNSPKYY